MTKRELQTGDKVDKNKMLIAEKADYRATVLALKEEERKLRRKEQH